MNKLLLFLTCVLISSNGIAEIAPYKLEKLFTIQKGYDSNDNVEVIALAKLPNHCFGPNNYKVEKTSSFEFKVSFDVKKKQITPCEEVQISDFSQPLYYTKTLSLGELKKGTYTVVYESFAENSKKVKFKVEASMTSGVDDIEYAPVTNAFIPELVYTSDNPMIILSGIFYSSCYGLDHESIEVNKQGNVYVVIPKVKYFPFQSCSQNERLLEGFVNLGPMNTPGTYLVHIRSQSGLSVNKVFHVKKKTFNPQGR